jgi:hypothetical protein
MKGDSMKSVYRQAQGAGVKTVVRWKGKDHYGGYFADSRFEQPEDAAARARDRIEREIGKRRSEQPVTWQRAKHYKALRMAVPQGVCYVERKVRGRLERSFVAYFNRPRPKPRLYATFPVAVWGLRMGLMMAVEARKQMERAATRGVTLTSMERKRRKA